MIKFVLKINISLTSGTKYNCIRTKMATKSNMVPFDDEYVKITEGSTTMNYNKKEIVFYNKVQVFNRDISVQVIKLFSKILQNERNERYNTKLARYLERKTKMKEHTEIETNSNDNNDRSPFPPKQGITILDALAASGLRSIRYLKEIPNVKHITINDLDPNAVKMALENCRTNQVSDEDIVSRVSIHHGDAALFMHQVAANKHNINRTVNNAIDTNDPLQPLPHHQHCQYEFDVVDLDLYGTASPFLDSAVQVVSDGGLLCVTCTDMPCLAGNYPEVCICREFLIVSPSLLINTIRFSECILLHRFYLYVLCDLFIFICSQ